MKNIFLKWLEFMIDADLNKLLLACGKGDKVAFRKLYNAVSPKMLAVLLRMLRDRQLAEDSLQEAMIAVWDAADTFDPSRSKASTWMISIARYRALDQLRKMGRYREVLDQGEGDIVEALFQENDENNPLSEATVLRLEDCFGKIGDEAAKSIKLAYLDGYTISEISKKISRPLGSVKSWVRRGLVSLRECVQA